MYRDIVLFCLALFLWGIGETTFFSFLPIYIQQMGANPIQIGTIIGGYGFIGLLIHIPAGYLADRIGRRPLIIVGWLVGFFSTLFMGLASTLPIFVMSLYLYISTVFIMAPMNSYISAARGKMSVQRALTFVSAFYNFGAIFGPLIGGSIGDKFGFRIIFFVAAGIFVLSNITIFFLKSQPVDGNHIIENNSGILANRSYLYFLLILFLVLFSTYLPQPLSPNYLQNQHQLSLMIIGRLFAINSFGIVLLNLFIGQLDPRKGFILSQLLMALMSLIMWRFSGFYWFSIAFFLLGSFRVIRVMATAITRSLVQSENMGLAFGIAEATGSAALIISPVVAGFLYEINPLSIFSVSSIVIGVFTILSFLFFYVFNNNKPKYLIRKSTKI